jgi:lipopolysaccharide biosynthesis glycosyltransferase
MKKKNCIVLGGTSNQAFAVACVLLDLKKFCSDWLEEVVYFHDGLDLKQQGLLNKIFPTKCIEYNFPINDVSIFDGNPSFSYFSKMVFCKFECLKLLANYSCVIWLDYDMIIKQSLRELIDFCDSGIKFVKPGYKVAAQFFKPIDEYDMELPAISGNVFVLQEHIGDYSDMHNYCYEFLKKYAKELYLGEQGVFDCLIQKYELNTYWLDNDTYSTHPKDPKANQANIKILHAYGQPKFWSGLENKQWNLNYKIWVKMGGQRKPNLFIKKLKTKLKKCLQYFCKFLRHGITNRRNMHD